MLNAVSWRYTAYEVGEDGFRMYRERCRYGCAGAASKYDLVANLVHDGAAGRGVYRAHIQRRSEGTWYEVQDLHVVDILPQARRCWRSAQD